MRGLPPHELVESALFSSICDVRQHMREFAGDPVLLCLLNEHADTLRKTVEELNQMKVDHV